MQRQLADLRTALAIATILDRVVILPRFRCTGKRTGGVLADCPLNALLGMTAFDAGFASRYRESSFLRHPLVPDAVRRSVSPRHVLATSTTGKTAAASTHHTNTTTHAVVHRISTDSMSDVQLRQLLGADTHRVLSLASLKNVHVTFTSAARQNSFDKTVNASFKRSDYRQLAKPTNVFS